MEIRKLVETGPGWCGPTPMPVDNLDPITIWKKKASAIIENLTQYTAELIVGFPSLGELIFVDVRFNMVPQVQTYLSHGSTCVAEEENIKAFSKFSEDHVKFLGTGADWLQRKPRTEIPPQFQVPKNMSKWWKEPKVTVLSVQEFEERYP